MSYFPYTNSSCFLVVFFLPGLLQSSPKLCRNDLWIPTKECTIASHAMCCVQELDHSKPREHVLLSALLNLFLRPWVGSPFKQQAPVQPTVILLYDMSKHMSFCYKFALLEKSLTPGAGEDIFLELEKVNYTFFEKCDPRGVLACWLHLRMGRQGGGKNWLVDSLSWRHNPWSLSLWLCFDFLLCVLRL